MAITKQDLRQIEAKTQDFEQLGLVSGATLNQIVDEINTDLDFPLKLTATFPTADSKLNFSNSKLSAPDGVNKIVPPVKKQIFPSLSSLYIDFQTQLTSSGFDIVWPSTNTVGKVRYVCFTLISSGNIKALFSDEYVDEATLTSPTLGFNPGGLFISGGLPVGYLIIECTNALGYYKTSGSATNIIDNAKIFRFGSGAGGGGGAGDANSFTENLKHRLVNSFFEYVTPVIFETVIYAISLAYGHTAVSLATTESATTKAPRRLPVGIQTFAQTAAVGVQPPSLQDDYTVAPICVQPGEFFQVVLRNLGAVTTTGAVTFVVGVTGYWE